MTAEQIRMKNLVVQVALGLVTILVTALLTIAVSFLGNISRSTESMTKNIQTLNARMIEVDFRTKRHDSDIVDFKKFKEEINRSFISEAEFKEHEKTTTGYMTRIWDALNEMRDHAAFKKK